jgi:hypothetical protein
LTGSQPCEGTGPDMFESYLVNPDSLRNEVHDGEVLGFCLTVRIANYRGVYLSLHNGYFLEVDGVRFQRDVQTFAINAKAPRTFDELKHAVNEHWDYEDDAVLHIAAPGGLGPGDHTVRFQQSVLAAYGYQPTDEEWVKHPPEPGTGAGSDKAPQIVTYTMALNEQPVH